MEITHSRIQSEAAPLPLHQARKDGESSRPAHQAMASGSLPHPRESTTLLPCFLKGCVSSGTTPIKPTHSIPLVIRPKGQIPLIDFTVQFGHYHSFPVLAIGVPLALSSHLLLQCGWGHQMLLVHTLHQLHSYYLRTSVLLKMTNKSCWILPHQLQTISSIEGIKLFFSFFKSWQI